MKSILVIRGGALGDFILTLPVLSALRARFPQSRIEVLGLPKFTSLAMAGKVVDGAASLEARPLSGFFARNGEWAPEASEYFARFDLIVSYLSDAEGIFRDNVARCSNARFIVGPHRPDEAVKLHATKVLLQPLEKLGILHPNSRPSLTLHSSLSTPHFFALHPGSGSERKNWPEAKWRSLLERLIEETTWSILLIGGEAEGDRVLRLAKKFPPARVEVAQDLPLVKLASKMAACQFFAGHDSGISHLAAALDLPGLILWGETVFEIWRPRGVKMKVMRHPDGLKGIAVDEVFRFLSVV